MPLPVPLPKKIIESQKKDKIIKNFGIFFVIILGEVI